MTTIPQWVPPLPSRADLANQRAANEITKSISGEGSPIPVIVGEAQVGGRVFAIDYDTGTSTWTVGVVWCFGEVESVVATYLNGAAPIGGVTVNTYTGTTTQAADALLSASISGYTDTLVISRPGGDVGVCYSVYQYTDSHYSDFPQFVAQIKGLKTSGGAYSASPVRALQFLIEDAVIGLDLNTDATSFNAAATQTDTEIVAGEKRREIGLVIDNILSFDKWITILAGYCSAWVNKVGDTYYLTPDRPRSSDATLTSADWAENSFGMTFADKDNTPTAVEVVYTDPTETIWRDRTVRAELTGVSSGTVPERISRVQMPGLTRYSQAIREANERLDKLNLTTSISFEAFDDQLALQLGDVITVTRGTHLSSKLFRVTAPPRKIFGEGVRVQATEYDTNVYSDLNPADPTFGANNGFLGDGVAAGTTTFYESTAPTASATGDLWFDTDDDSVSRWNGSTWEAIQDNNIAQALADASTAKTTADGKIVTFVQASAPTADGTGDLWFDSDNENKLYRWSGSAWVGYPQDYAVWSQVSGANKPSDNATQNTGALADADTVDLSSTGSGGVSNTLPELSGGTGLTSTTTLQNSEIRPYGAVSFGSTIESVVYTDAVEKCGKIYSASDTTSGAVFPAFPVSLDSTDGALEISIALKTSLTSGSRSNGLYIRVSEYDAALPEGATHVVSNAADAHADCISHDRFGSLSPSHENRSSTAGWTVYTTTYTPTSTAQFASLVLYNWVNLGSGTETLWFKEPIIRPAINIDVTMVADVVQTRFTSADGGSTYYPTATTQVVNIQAISSGSETCTVTWTRSGVNVDSAVLSGSGFTMSSFGSAGVEKTVTVTHTASSAAIAVSCEVVETDLTGGSGK